MTSQPVELPTHPGPPLAASPAGEGERDRLVRRAKTLAWLSLAWMTVEGAVAISAALIAGSVALLGFGIDSTIEGLASVIVIWRFTGSRRLSVDAERRAQKLVAISFFLLAPYIAQAAIRALVNGEHPATSWVGIGLSIGSILVMPVLGRAKQRIGTKLGSAATAGEGAQNLLCAYMAGGVLVGLAANTALAWWWLDPVIGLAIAALAISEGREVWAGEGCCIGSPIPTREGSDGHCCSGETTSA
jgi:divalent metal cation (Fe/Co/Zn/Cd) transporter